MFKLAKTKWKTHHLILNLKKLTELLGIKYSIIQAPVGGVAIPSLTAADSNTGCLGSAALNWSDSNSTTQTIKSILAKTNKPFYSNYI